MHAVDLAVVQCSAQACTLKFMIAELLSCSQLKQGAVEAVMMCWYWRAGSVSMQWFCQLTAAHECSPVLYGWRVKQWAKAYWGCLCDCGMQHGD